MQLSLTINAINLLKHTLIHTGSKEIAPTGQEVNSLRTLNGEDSSQRRHFIKNSEPASKAHDEKIKEFREEVEKMRKEKAEKFEEENPKLEGEKDEIFKRRINTMVGADKEFTEKMQEINKAVGELLKVKYEFEINDKTAGVVKKCFNEYSESAGFLNDDDEGVEEICVAFGITY